MMPLAASYRPQPYIMMFNIPSYNSGISPIFSNHHNADYQNNVLLPARGQPPISTFTIGPSLSANLSWRGTQAVHL